MKLSSLPFFETPAARMASLDSRIEDARSVVDQLRGELGRAVLDGGDDATGKEKPTPAQTAFDRARSRLDQLLAARDALVERTRVDQAKADSDEHAKKKAALRVDMKQLGAEGQAVNEALRNLRTTVVRYIEVQARVTGHAHPRSEQVKNKLINANMWLNEALAHAARGVPGVRPRNPLARGDFLEDWASSLPTIDDIEEDTRH